ncbi:hypothetical protein [Maribacter aquivivus]|uniref:hypothetical protein n=1 Tax=Maribacter aquivivus TaxID=228958 RepID=UPI0024939DBC|nr:hypothetical protein [Maribacter aquivivus]
MKTKLLILVILVSSTMNGQSFFTTEINDTIFCEYISISNKFLKFSNIKTGNDSKIDLEKVTGYYLEGENVFFQKKEFKTRTVFFDLGKDLKDAQGFSELIIEGKVKAYRGKTFANDTGAGTPQLLNQWYIEKGDLFEEAFIADYDSGSMRLDRASFGQLNREFFESLISEDKIALVAFKNIKNHGNLTQLLKILNDYNSRDFRRNQENKINVDSAKIVLFRDFGKELKEVMKISVNGMKYELERNSKLELKIPSNIKSEVCIENSSNNYCMILSSSLSYPKYYRLKLNKKSVAYIVKVNGHSSYYQTRLDYYDKRANQ